MPVWLPLVPLTAIMSIMRDREVIEELKAWTCAAHILTTQGKRMIDTSEGYVFHEGDKIYWQRVHESLANIY